MKTARYGVETISIWCPNCFDFFAAPDGSLQFAEEDVEKLPPVMECAYCGGRFRKPVYPQQRFRAQKAA
jgi:hypothetical protein